MAKRINFKAILIILPFLALIGYTGYRVYETTKSGAQQTNGGPGGGGRGPGGGGGPGRGGFGGGAGRVQQVQTGVVSTGRISEKISLTGTLRAKQQVDVNSKIAGRVTRVLVDTGLPVARGALIAVVEDDEIKQQIERSKASISLANASIAQREAELNNAKAELDRKKRLVEEGILTQQELDVLDMRLRVSESQLELARAQKRQFEAEQKELNIRLDQTRINAPISGIVSKRHVDIGAMVSSANPIASIVSVSPMVIDAQVPERDISKIRRGANVSVLVDSLPGQKFTGRIMRISPLLNPQTRNGMVEIEIPNRDAMLKGEMFARIELDLGSSRDAVLIPRDALVYRGDKPGVFTIANGSARFTLVDTGLTQNEKVELLGGLNAGDTVITQGANMLKDGDRVRVGGGPGGRGRRPDGGPGAGPPGEKGERGGERGGPRPDAAAGGGQTETSAPSQQRQRPENQGDNPRRGSSR